MRKSGSLLFLALLLIGCLGGGSGDTSPTDTENSTYTVTYNGNGNTGGSVPIDTTKYVQGQTVTGLGNTGSLVKTDYSFSGWNTQADGSGWTRMPGQGFTIGPTNTVLYAMWTAIVDLPKVEILPVDIDISVPQNIPQNFSIYNTGGGRLSYLVADDGVLGGFLDIQYASGSEPSGEHATVVVSGKPEFFSDLSMVGTQLVLSVFTPDAFNYIESHVTVHIITTEIVVESSTCTFLGRDSSGHNLFRRDWSGTATGAVNDELWVFPFTTSPGETRTLTCEGWSKSETGDTCVRRFRSEPLMTQWSAQETISFGTGGPLDTTASGIIGVVQNGNYVAKKGISFFCAAP